MSNTNVEQFKSCCLAIAALVDVLLLRFEVAEQRLSQAISASSSVSYNWGLRAYVRIRLDNFDGAISDCSEKLVLKPDDASMYALRGWAHYCLSNYGEAIEDIERSIELEPKRKTFYQDSLRLIDSYQCLSQDREAIEFCDVLTKTASLDYFVMELNVRKAASLMNLGEYEESLLELDKALLIATGPDLAYLHKMKADVLKLDGRDDLAMVEEEKCKSLKLKQARLTEWVPASSAKRVLAGFMDGALLGVLAVILFLVIVLGGMASQGLLLAEQKTIVSMLIPYMVLVFCFAFVDSLLVFIIPTLVSVFVFNICIQGSPISPAQIGIVVLFSLLMASNFTYHSRFITSGWQGTPGKYWLGIRITGPGGDTLPLARSVLRHGLKGLFFLSLALVVGASLDLFQQIMPIASNMSVSILWTLVLFLSLGVSLLIALKPGLHNLVTGSLVSDVRLYGGLSRELGLPEL